MFFNKKKPATSPSNRASDKRAEYRKQTSKAQPLEATLTVRNSAPLSVELLDLTVRGAGIAVPFAKDRNLKLGELVELRIGNMMRSEILTPARVANVGKHGESHVRYGLEFINIGNLYSQLDAFYARHFNRRKQQRVRPSLDRKIKATLRWGAEEIVTNVYDLSEVGLGVMVTKDTSARTLDVPGMEISFKLPGAIEPFCGRAKIRHRTPLYNQILLGLTFDMEQEGGFKDFTGELRRFIEQRANDIAKWEQSWG